MLALGEVMETGGDDDEEGLDGQFEVAKLEPEFLTIGALPG